MPDSIDIGDALAHFARRRIALLCDTSSPEGRSVLVAGAESITPETVNEMISLSGGLLCVALSPERTAAFLLPPMQRPTSVVAPPGNLSDRVKTCISVEAREGVTTGISAADRARTIQVLGEQIPNARKLVRPGHIFPVQVREGGVLIRHALPEGALDIVRMVGFSDAAAYLEVINCEGEYASLEEIRSLASQYQLPMISLDQITRYRLQQEKIVEMVAEARLPTRLAGELRSYIYRSKIHSGEHLALVKGEINPELPTVTRVQSEFTFGDVFGGSTPPTRLQIDKSLEAIGNAPCGAFLYLRRPSRGQLRAQISDWEAKFVEKPASMMREYGVGAQILRDLGIHKVTLLTNSPRELSGVEAFGIEIIGTQPLFDG